MEPEDFIEEMLEGIGGEADIEIEVEEIELGGEGLPEPMSEMDVKSIVQNSVSEAASFVETYIAPKRIRAQRYYDGGTDLTFEEGRSKIVSTKVRDTIRAVTPSLMRIFMTTSKPVEFTPIGPSEVESAEQATNFIHSEFTRLDGYKALNDAFSDALIKGQGIIKTYFKDYSTAEIISYSELSQEEFDFISNEDGITVLETEMSMQISEVPEVDPMTGQQVMQEVEVPSYSLKVSHKSTKGEMCIECIPPESFLVSEDAKTLEDATVVAHQSDMRVADVVNGMGIPFEEVSGLDAFYDDGVGYASEEAFQRQGYYSEESSSVTDPSMKMVAITEAYIRLDIDGTGTPILYKFICGGTSYEVLDYTVCDQIPFAKFESEPVPHAFYGDSLASMLETDQDSCTSVLRGILDNVAMVNSPRLAVVEGQASIDDVLNGEIGSIVRVRQAGAVQELTTPFVAGQTLPMLNYLDILTESKSGVTSTSTGLNSDTLQSTTAQAVNATVEASQGQLEVYARNLAMGMRDLFKLMLHDYRTNVDEERVAKVNGNFVPVDPRTWNDMDVSINVGLGTGKNEKREAGLSQTLQLQTEIFANYGPQNGLVSLTNIRATLTDMMAMAGINNSERYFQPMDAQKEQMMMQQQAQQAQQQAQQQGSGDGANQAFIAGEQIKAQANMQKQQMSDNVKMQTEAMKLAFDRERLAVESDLKMDQLNQDLVIDAAEIAGKYQTTIDTERLKAEQAMPRNQVQGVNNVQ